ncbi:MAG TPA: tautomerase family protein [Acidimicrobiales bacterium]|nr:tautomerase family protein [Acidimicrobiales bacterium]
MMSVWTTGRARSRDRPEAGWVSPDRKKDMIAKLTETMVAVEGENMRPVTWVIIEDVASGELGIGGNARTTADVKTVAAGAPVG